jgi:very-short-patch-repair endonuclease
MPTLHLLSELRSRFFIKRGLGKSRKEDLKMDGGSLARIRPRTTAHARQLRTAMTDAERFLWQDLRLRQFDGYKFRRQHPLGHYVLDFVCLTAKLVVEVDGGQHSEQNEYDASRTEWLRQKGFRVLRFWNHEVMKDIEAVRTVIWAALHEGSQPPS